MAQLAKETEALRALEPLPSVAPITEAERQLWGELEKRLQARFLTEPELPRAVGVVANLARSSGMALISLGLQRRDSGAATQPQSTVPPFPSHLPPEFVMNRSTIKLVATHRYRDLVAFLEGLRRAPIILTVQSLEVKREENRLTAEVSFALLQRGK